MSQLLSPMPLGPRQLSPDQLTIDTPEQVSIRFPVAGLGSRFLAILADTVLQIIAYALLILLVVLIISSAPKDAGGALLRIGEKWLVAAFILIHFAMYWGYFTLFETFWNGQTPGKKLCKIRVIQMSGRQITFFEAMTRNLIRIADMFPGPYLVGIVTMLCNRRHQRLGDLAASTLVVHERPGDEPVFSAASRTITAAAFETAPPEPSFHHIDEPALPADAVARLTSDDLTVIDRFFSRILDMELDTRARIAERLAAQMSGKMGLPLTPETKPERFLEAISHQMRSHGR